MAECISNKSVQMYRLFMPWVDVVYCKNEQILSPFQCVHLWGKISTSSFQKNYITFFWVFECVWIDRVYWVYVSCAAAPCQSSWDFPGRQSRFSRGGSLPGRWACFKMIVDLLLLVLSIIVFLYDFLTFPIYWLVQQPWKKRWECWKTGMMARSTVLCRSHALLVSSPSVDTSWQSQSPNFKSKHARVKPFCARVTFLSDSPLLSFYLQVGGSNIQTIIKCWNHKTAKWVMPR